MRKNIDLTQEEYAEIIENFYKYFETGYKFEEFLKVYLEKIGLEEVFVTKKSGDGGIDLTAIRKGIGGFSNAVDQQIYIQAKRYSPSSSVPPEKIRALRGSFANGSGLFITTGKVSDQAKTEARETDPSRPIIVVDGKELVSSCIENEIGFTFKPAFSKIALDSIMSNTSANTESELSKVERIVTENDIRSYILTLPRAIKDVIPENAQKIKIRFGNGTYNDYRIDASRRYVGGISKVYKEFNLRQPDGVFTPKKAVWQLEPDSKFTVNFMEF